MRALHEPRQRAVALEALRALGYDEVANEHLLTPGMYGSGISVHLPSPGKRGKRVQVDLMIAPHDGSPHIFVELKSAGDETNPNKRRKEDVERPQSLRQTRGRGTRYVVLRGGHFNSTYIGHLRASKLEWVWEHDALAGLRAILRVATRKRATLQSSLVAPRRRAITPAVISEGGTNEHAHHPP